MPTGRIICKCCNQLYDAISMVTCCICKEKFKNTCVDITANEVRTLNSNKGYDWTCANCRPISHDIKNLKSLLIDLQREIKELRAVTNPPSKESSLEFEDIVAEVSERHKREKNIIIFNIAEQDQQKTPAAKSEGDKIQVVNILNSIVPDLSLAEVKPIRLGSFSSNKIRPIKISLENGYAAKKVLKNAKKLKSHQVYKNVNISSDKTKRQIDFYKKTKQELKNRLEAGENNLKIKYINQVPRIVSEN